MPFEIAPKKLPLHEQLAALMEAGRAAHPGIRHVRRDWGNGHNTGCAMMIAGLGAGINSYGRRLRNELATTMGVSVLELDALMGKVVNMNDATSATLDDIIRAVREDDFPKAALRSPQQMAADKLVDAYIFSMQETMQLMSVKSFQWIAFDEAAPAKISVGTSAVPKIDKTIRVSAKTGASWPKPKHAFA